MGFPLCVCCWEIEKYRKLSSKSNIPVEQKKAAAPWFGATACVGSWSVRNVMHRFSMAPSSFHRWEDGNRQFSYYSPENLLFLSYRSQVSLEYDVNL